MTQKAFIYITVNDKTVTHSISIDAVKELLKRHPYKILDDLPELNPLSDYTKIARIVIELVDNEINNQNFYFFDDINILDMKNFLPLANFD